MNKMRLLAVSAMILSSLVFIAASADDANESAVNEKVNPQAERAEPNEVPAEESPKALLEKAWADANDTFEAETRGWMSQEGEQVNIARASLRTTEAELHLLRMLAQSEGAEQTVAAIDKLLAERTARVNEFFERAKNSRREEINRQKEERRKAYEERRRSRQTEQ